MEGKVIRVWLFRILILIGAGLMLYTWLQPWWSAYVLELDVTAVDIYPWALVSYTPPEYAYLISGADNALPVWYTPFMWVYISVCILALLGSLFISSKKGLSLGKIRMSFNQLFPALVGLSYIGVVVAAVLVISANAATYYNAPLQGTIIVSIDSGTHSSSVDTTLMLGYWLACGTGPLLILLALLRNLVTGKAGQN
jgi:hypothetical protein